MVGTLSARGSAATSAPLDGMSANDVAHEEGSHLHHAVHPRCRNLDARAGSSACCRLTPAPRVDSGAQNTACRVHIVVAILL
ncbi:MAG: hypothetical protein WAU15_11920 [Nitrosomonas sp.]